jgi:OOP family OmpA-OmpF porin
MKKLLLSTSVAVVLSSSLMAEYTIEPVVTKSFTKSSSSLDDYSSFGVKVSRELVDSLSLQLGYEYADDAEYKGSNTTTDLMRYSVNALYDFKNSSNVTPYIYLGGGYEKVNNKHFGLDSQAIWNTGLGVKYALTETVSLFTEGRFTHKVETEDNDKSVGFGVSIKFGGEKQQPVQPVAEPVKEAPKAVEAPKVEAPKDGDKDGVVDAMDKCLNTPKGLKVDKDGCALNFNFHVNFDFDKANIKPEYKAKVLEFAQIMKENPMLNAVIEGHTDSVGSDAYNEKLSAKRAEAVRNALISEGIEASRLKAVGYGEAKPIADNKTKDGRYENRRVEANTDIK